jgi:hypothetical protein
VSVFFNYDRAKSFSGRAGELMERMGHRQSARFDLNVPFWIQLPNSPETPAQLVEASNISATGLYFVTDLVLQVGTAVDISLLMPEVVVGKQLREWCCRGRVARVAPGELPDGKPGIGVEFQYYEVLKSENPNELAQPVAIGPYRTAE